MIDVLSKYAVVVPIKGKTPPEIIAGTMEGLYTEDDSKAKNHIHWRRKGYSKC